MAGLAVAFGFMTRVPVGRRADLDGDTLSRAALWFPAVGVVVGLVMAGVHGLAALALGPAPSTVLALAAAALLTGGFHEDGLADCADAFGAHVDRARRLEILHDPRLGTYGTVTLALATLFAFSVLAPLDGEHFLRAAVVGGVLGRWTTLPLSSALPRATPSGSGALVRATAPLTLAASAMAFGVALPVGGWPAGAAAIGAAAAIAALGGLAALRVLGGVTGDVFGAVNKLAELAAYAALVAVWG